MLIRRLYRTHFDIHNIDERGGPLKKTLIVIWIIYLGVLVFALIPYKIPETTKGSYGLTRLYVRDLDAYNAQYTVIKGEKELAELFVGEEIEVETDKLILTGNIPSNKLSRADLLNTDIIIHGRVLGKAELAPGSGYVVEYHVDKWSLVTYMPMVMGIQGEFLSYLFLIEILLSPIMVIGTIIIVLKRLSKQKVKF